MPRAPKPPEPAPAARSPRNKERPGQGVEFTQKAIRMTAAYADWLERFARARRLTVADLVDHLAAEGAKAAGFEAPPERLP